MVVSEYFSRKSLSQVFIRLRLYAAVIELVFIGPGKIFVVFLILPVEDEAVVVLVVVGVVGILELLAEDEEVAESAAVVGDCSWMILGSVAGLLLWADGCVAVWPLELRAGVAIPGRMLIPASLVLRVLSRYGCLKVGAMSILPTLRVVVNFFLLSSRLSK